MLGRLALGIDIGGTKIAAGVVDEDGRVIAADRRRTPTTDAGEVLAAIVDMVETLRAAYPIKAIGIGAAGFVDASRSTVLFAPHLAWRNEALRDKVARHTGLPVLVDNDATASGWAEWRFGAAQNEPDVVLVTLGTGIGGAIVLDGQPYRGRHGLAGEFGHMRVEPEGRPCPCGGRGCWEQYASGTVLTRRAQQEVADGTPFGRRLREAATGGPIEGETVSELAASGDAEAIAWLADVGAWLGRGLADVAAALDPGLIVVGGGVSRAGDLLLQPAREAFGQSLVGRRFRAEPRIVQAHLGAAAGLIGAADLARFTARRRRLASPTDRVRVRATGRTARPPRPQS